MIPHGVLIAIFTLDRSAHLMIHSPFLGFSLYAFIQYNLVYTHLIFHSRHSCFILFSHGLFMNYCGLVGTPFALPVLVHSGSLHYISDSWRTFISQHLPIPPDLSHCVRSSTQCVACFSNIIVDHMPMLGLGVRVNC